MTAKKKPKFPATREKKSELSKSNGVAMSIFSTIPRTEITIKAELSETCQNDLRAAIDEVLSYHGY